MRRVHLVAVGCTAWACLATPERATLYDAQDARTEEVSQDFASGGDPVVQEALVQEASAPDTGDESSLPEYQKDTAALELTQELVSETVVMPTECTVVQLALGAAHSCALCNVGRVFCWGNNSSNQVAPGPDYAITRPEPVADFGKVTRIAAGTSHTCAVTLAGSLHCWGSNQHKQIDGSDSGRYESPHLVQDLPSVIDVACGRDRTCVLLSDHKVTCWGDDRSGKWNHSIDHVQQIVSGEQTSCALDDKGDVHCWGPFGSAATKVPGLAGIVQIAAGAAHFCALVNPGLFLRCWGVNSEGQLGSGAPGDDVTDPVEVSGLSGVSRVAAGSGHTCAVTLADEAWCWGRNEEGQLGIGGNEPQYQPMKVATPPTKVQEVEAGDHHTCLLTKENRVWCFGANGNGQLGDGSTNHSPVPIEIAVGTK